MWHWRERQEQVRGAQEQPSRWRCLRGEDWRCGCTRHLQERGRNVCDGCYRERMKLALGLSSAWGNLSPVGLLKADMLLVGKVVS